MSLGCIVRTSPDPSTDPSPKKKANFAFNREGESQRVGKAIITKQAVRSEMQRSYSHGHSRTGSGGGNSRIAWKRLGGTGEGDNETDDPTAKNLGLGALEIGEVEPQMFRQLALLCSVREYAVVREQLAHPSALRSIFSLLKVGSPRMQR